MIVVPKWDTVSSSSVGISATGKHKSLAKRACQQKSGLRLLPCVCGRSFVIFPEIGRSAVILANLLAHVSKLFLVDRFNYFLNRNDHANACIDARLLWIPNVLDHIGL